MPTYLLTHDDPGMPWHGETVLVEYVCWTWCAWPEFMAALRRRRPVRDIPQCDECKRRV